MHWVKGSNYGKKKKKHTHTKKNKQTNKQTKLNKIKQNLKNSGFNDGCVLHNHDNLQFIHRFPFQFFFNHKIT